MVISLVVLGALSAYAASQQKRCVRDDPSRPDNCRSPSGGSSGGHGYFGTGRSAQSPQGTVTRGGFGAVGRAFSGFGS
jgi:hypothetical protein